nr:MFS transporter [Desulfobacula sp.]
MGAGIGTFVSPNNSAIMGMAPRHQLGIVSGMMAQSRTLGQTVGVAVIGGGAGPAAPFSMPGPAPAPPWRRWRPRSKGCMTLFTQPRPWPSWPCS